MSFELFVPPLTKRSQKTSRSQTVYYNPKQGKLSIRKQIFDEFLNSEYVKIYFDRKESKIGIEPVSESEQALKINGKNIKYISIGKFVKHFEIDVPSKVDIPVEHDKDNNMVVFKIV